MSRKDDVVRNFMTLPAVTAIESEKILTLLEQAVSYGFEQGESFGKYEALAEKQNEKMPKAVTQSENDKVWREELESIRKDDNAMSLSLSSVQWKIVHLLYLIVEILLVRKNGD